jgi:4-hydroxy-tetrahydrodipicolinate reductase
LADLSPDFKIAGAFETAKNPAIGKDAGEMIGLGKSAGVAISTVSVSALSRCDVLIDFSAPQGVREGLAAAVKAKKAVVIGTTGIDRAGESRIRAASRKVPVLYSPNMSIGANFLFELARLAAAKLKNGYDIEIIEAHHRLKKDAPSGTAKKIAEVIAGEKGWDLAKTARFGRQGIVGERAKREIGIHVVRAGDIVGEHTVLFGGPGEKIELSHTAISRDAFARGALVAAAFVAKKAKGLYGMADVLK